MKKQPKAVMAWGIYDSDGKIELFSDEPVGVCVFDTRKQAIAEIGDKPLDDQGLRMHIERVRIVPVRRKAKVRK